MKTILYGSHHFLNVCPIYIVIIVSVILYSGILILRKIYEGKAYDVALSSMFGDNIFLLAFIIGAGLILKQPNYQPSSWMESPIFHWVVAGCGILASLIYGTITKQIYAGDRYHAFVLFPFYFYLVITCAPVYYDQPGSNWLFVLGIGLLLGWFILVIIDIKFDRMNQRKWIDKNRLDWHFKFKK